ncbi:glutamine amidotransferase [Tessaracoccus sp. SD287]|uniref:type 1 glutamine amidotransferase n=1 Tax=Tessaracoccus sp. SD287 TaxID=2782008 RepID=UPI001A95FFD1|nr:glutamine amidotransferase [Tessaracoccus sp. SD287]MBO1030404.1 glutamine amidotransferase [Tessaracoccus sp. SD287]
MTFTIALVYQSLLGVYGDRGNSTVLLQRLLRRGLDAELVICEPGDTIPADAQVYLLGGGEDLAQISAVRALTADGNLFRGLDAGGVLLAVCAGFQICGTSFTVGENDVVHEGLGLLDVSTRRGPSRAVGEILTEWTRPDGSTSLITGFENHGGYTTLGPAAKPLARVRKGVGNDGTGFEGAVQGNIIGTYPHGPVLARNPALADHLLELALGHPLEPLPMPSVDALRSERIAAIRA